MDQNEGSKDRLKIGISSCLLGNEVRFDGGHKKDYFLTGTLSRFVDYIPACPEVEIGLGIPRETLRLEKSGGSVRLVTNKTKKDITEKMRTYSGKQVAIVDKMDLDGYILKKDSPSCGMERMKVYSEKGIPEKNGRGVFAEVLLEKYPLLPVEEEGRLQDSKLRENFFTRVFAYARLKAFFSAKWTYRDLIGFHSKEKLLLMAHDNESYRLLGRMVAEGSRKDREELVREYPEIFMRALKKHATVSRNFNVLQHIWGFVKDKASDIEKKEVLEITADYKKGLVPLVVPVTLLKHHLLVQGVDYLLGQTYLCPSPKELMLRNHC